MSAEFNPQRLKLARSRQSLTRKALAQSIGVAPLTITRIEKGESSPEDETVVKLADALLYPKDFFYGPDIDSLTRGSASFRSLSGMSAKEREAALAAGSIAYIIMDWVSDRFNLPGLDLLDFRHEPDPAAAARTLRHYWGLGEQPVSNVIKLLESKGVRVFSLAENTRKVDAFSCWRDETPYVFLNTLKSAERSRFDALHELGHLVMHRHGESKGRTAEMEANLFASHFLMPPADIASRIPLISTLDQLIQLKSKWGVSTAALAYRLNKDTYLSDWVYRGFCIELNQRFGHDEPNPMDRERSAVWSQVLTSIWQDGITVGRLANKLNLPEAEVAQLLFGLTGKRKSDLPENNTGLRLV